MNFEMTVNRTRLLEKLIQPLVDEWGREAVLKALEQLPDKDRLEGSQREPHHAAGASDARVRPIKRPSALRMALNSEHRDKNLLVIAEKYDRREFLPSVADAREFMAMFGEANHFLKDRSDAFRHLLRLLSQMPPEQLERLANDVGHLSPTRLGPISDAIRSAGEALRRDKKLPA